MSTITVSTINTINNTTPLYLTTGNNTVGVDLHAANGAINIKGSEIRKNGTILGAGKQTMWLPAGAFTSRVTNGPALTQIVMAGGANIKSYDFDPATIEFIELQIRMPKSWDKGTLTFTPVMTQLTTSAGSASWNLAVGAASSGDGTDITYGTPVTVTVSAGTANTLYVGSESSAITSAGSPQEGDLLALLVSRFATGSSDTLAIDGKLIGINMYYTANTDSDA
jgi:hypothetical protein